MAPARTIGATMFAMALAGAAAAGDRAAPAPAPAIGSGSSLPQAQLDPTAAALPARPRPPEKADRPDDQRILMLMLLSHTQFGPFGRLAQ